MVVFEVLVVIAFVFVVEVIMLSLTIDEIVGDVGDVGNNEPEGKEVGDCKALLGALLKGSGS